MSSQSRQRTRWEGKWQATELHTKHKHCQATANLYSELRPHGCCCCYARQGLIPSSQTYLWTCVHIFSEVQTLKQPVLCSVPGMFANGTIYLISDCCPKPNTYPGEGFKTLGCQPTLQITEWLEVVLPNTPAHSESLTAGCPGPCPVDF